MAGDWIKIEHTTPDKPEVIAIAETLRIDPDAVVGKLLRIWIWADLNSVDGNGMTVTDAFLDRITHRRGFAAAMRVCGWLDGGDGALIFPGFHLHNGHSAKARADTNRRVAKHRKCNGESVANVTAAPLQKPLPEKRREEKKEERESAGAKASAAGDPKMVCDLYPRREKTAEALVIVGKHLANGEDFEAMLAGTRAAAAVIRTLPSGHLNRYVPSAESFFREKRWKDDPETLRRQGSQSTGQGKIDDAELDRMLGRRANPEPANQ